MHDGIVRVFQRAGRFDTEAAQPLADPAGYHAVTKACRARQVQSGGVHPGSIIVEDDTRDGFEVVVAESAEAVFALVLCGGNDH